jgi:hypothetical protein
MDAWRASLLLETLHASTRRAVRASNRVSVTILQETAPTNVETRSLRGAIYAFFLQVPLSHGRTRCSKEEEDDTR